MILNSTLPFLSFDRKIAINFILNVLAFFFCPASRGYIFALISGVWPHTLPTTVQWRPVLDHFGSEIVSILRPRMNADHFAFPYFPNSR